LQQIVSQFPVILPLLFCTFTAVVMLLVFYTDWKLRDRLEWMSKGLDTWAITHEGLEIAYVAALFALSPLFFPMFNIFIRGLCVLGPLIALIGAEKVYAERTGGDFGEWRDETIIGTTIFLVVANLLFPSMPALMLGLLLYAPVIVYLSLSGILVYKSGAVDGAGLSLGLILIGVAHEPLEAFLFHKIGIKILRGVDPSVGGGMGIFLVFLVLQLIGPAILAVWAYTRD